MNEQPDGTTPVVNETTPPPESDPVASTPAPEVHPAPEQPAPMQNPVAAGQATSFQSNAAHKEAHARNNKKLAVGVTLIIAFLAAGAAVYVYVSAQSNTVEAPTVQQSTSNTEDTTVEPADSTAVDETVNDIDETINSVDETTDFDDSTLSDESLQLE